MVLAIQIGARSGETFVQRQKARGKRQKSPVEKGTLPLLNQFPQIVRGGLKPRY